MDKIIQEMSRIYSMFCCPRGILNTETREITFENVWRNSDAEAYYNTLAEILKTQQADQHAHESELLSMRCPECGGSVGHHHVLCPLA